MLCIEISKKELQNIYLYIHVLGSVHDNHGGEYLQIEGKGLHGRQV